MKINRRKIDSVIDSVEEYLAKKLVGVRVVPKVSEHISNAGHHAYRMSCIYGAREEFLRTRFAPHVLNLGDRFVGRDRRKYQEIADEQLYPLVRELRYVLQNELYLPIVPTKSIPTDTLSLNRGLAALHADCIGSFDSPAPLNFTIVDTLDPTFNIQVNDKRCTNLREDLTLEMNSDKLRSLMENSPAAKTDLERRAYEIREKEILTVAYTLEGIKGRDKEIPPIKYENS